MTFTRIKLMADYGCFPLWNVGNDVGNIDPEELPISSALKEALGAWGDAFDATLDEDDPLKSGFPSPEAAEAFARDGQRLAGSLRAELGDSIDILYAAP